MKAASKALAHRGPDNEGYIIQEQAGSLVAFGHTQLSVIDLSSTNKQPFICKEGRYVIVYDGRIYNHGEIRNELSALGRSFSTNSVAELLTQAWAEWGMKCLARLTGMFAFAIWDRAEASISLCRDAFGIKPLFYSLQNGTLLFASEITAVQILRDSPARINHQRAYEYLVREYYDANEETFFDGINHLLPGNVLRFDVRAGEVQELSSWNDFSIVENTAISFEQASEKIRDLFLNSIRLHMGGDVPLGALLSGGLDSSAIVCAMRHIDSEIDIHTFTFISPEGDDSEEHWADIVNHNTNAISHKIVLSSDGLMAGLDRLILSQGEPFGSTSLYAQHGVCRQAYSSGIKVILDGQGADGLLAGNAGYPVPRLHSLLERGRFIKAAYFLGNWSGWPNRGRLKELKRAIDEVTTGHLNALLRRVGGHPLFPQWVDAKKLDGLGVMVPHNRIPTADDAYGRRLPAYLRYVITRRGLPLLLRHVDRNSMAFSIEARTPFLTTELAHLVMSLPESYLVSDKGETKTVFRTAMKGIVPEEILYRKDKIAFSAPEYKWLRPHTETIKRWLTQDLNLSWIDNEGVVREFDMLMSRQQNLSSQQVWRWICFARWQYLYELQE